MDYMPALSISSLFEPAALAVLLVAVAYSLTLLPRTGSFRPARHVVAAGLFFMVLCVFFPLGEVALRPLENAVTPQPLPEKVDGIVMLTGDESPVLALDRHFPASGAATQRHLHTARLARRYPEARIVLVGGTPDTPSAALYPVRKILAENMAAMGVQAQRITFEEHSLNTHENALFARALINPSKEEKWVLVTSAYHMPRAVLSFGSVGWDVIPSPSDYLTLSGFAFASPVSLCRQLRLLSVAAHEYWGLIGYRIYGWIDRLWV